MAASEQPYDPYIPSGSAGAPAATGQNGNQRTAALQAVSQIFDDIFAPSDRSH